MSTIDRNRFARHLMIREIGEAGQARILDAHFMSRQDLASEVASDYLRRAGATVDDSGSTPLRLPPTAAVGEYQIALDTIRGACSAIEALRSAVGLADQAPADPLVLIPVHDG